MSKEDYRFFYPDGTEMADKEEFIKFYSKAYYLNQDMLLEIEIENLLEAGIRNKQDILTILRWKIGGTEINDSTVKNQYLTITINDELEECVVNRCITSDEEALTALKKIMETDNIGFTYAITLLYFMSKGRYPIYDKFAHIALMIICDKSPFKSIIKDSELKGKGRGKKRIVNVPSDIDKKASDKDKKIEEAFEKYKENYIKPINDIFEIKHGEEMISDRTFDRALWLYGHLFNDNERNRRRVKYLK